MVTENGDTLTGTINNADWDISPFSIAFRPENATTAVTRTVSEIKSFGIIPTNERYVRISTRLDKTPQKIDFLPKTKRIDWEDDTFFAKQLIQGDLSLFMHKDKQEKKHYLIRRLGEVEQDLVQLRYQETELDVVTIDHYKQQLKALAEEYPGLPTKLKTLRFNRESLTEFVDAYNMKRSGKSSIVQDKSNRKGKFGWGISVGALRSNYSVYALRETLVGGNTGSSPVTTSGQTKTLAYYKGTVLPTGGIWWLYSSARARQQWSIYAALNLQSINASIGSEYKVAVARGPMKATYAKVLTGIHWMMPAGHKVRPFVMIGVSNGYALTEMPLNFLAGNRRYEQALVGFVGCQVSRWQVDLRFERGNGASNMDEDYINIPTRSRTIGLMLGYKFSKK